MDAWQDLNAIAKALAGIEQDFYDMTAIAIMYDFGMYAHLDGEFVRHYGDLQRFQWSKLSDQLFLSFSGH